MNLAIDHYRNKITVLKILSLLFAVSSACAETTSMANLEQGTGSEAHVMHLASEHDLTFGADITLIGQKTDDRPDGSVLNYSVDLAFESNLGDQGKAFIYLIDAEGQTIDTDAGSGSPNADFEAEPGGSELRVAEAWYEVPLGETSSMRVGKIDTTGIYDGNDFANDQTTQFLADAFVNNGAIGFPDYSPGLNFNYRIKDSISLNAGVFESTSSDTYLAGTASDAFSIAELALHGQLVRDLNGNLRLTVWHDDAIHNEGAALNADQLLSDNIGVFVRYGSQKKTQEFDRALSLGGQWSSKDDVTGIGYSIAYATGVVGRDNERQLEVYYSHAVTAHVHVTADIQHVTNPGFSKSQDDATVYGVRVQTDL